MTRILIGTAVLLASATAASAGVMPPNVPEIDALSGLAAIAAVGGVGALVWERRRRK